MNILALKRHTSPEWSNIPKEKIVIVINTTNDDYREEAEQWCIEEGIEYHITESNGTPAKGKNSLLDIFSKSDDEYMVQVDGDDFVTPHGVFVYDTIAKMDSPPDAVSLIHQISRVVDWETIHAEENHQYDYDSLLYETCPYLYVHYFTADWESISKASIYDELVSYGCTKEKAMEFQGYHREFYRLQNMYCDVNESHSRVTWLSKKAVAKHRFPEDLIVGEDTVFYYYLKNDGLTGKLDVRYNDEFPPTYVYDQLVPGTVFNEVKEGKDWTWMGVYNKKLYEMEEEGVLHDNKNLPELKIDYPANYKPKCIGFDECKDYKFTYGDLDGSFKAPANASEKTLHNMFDYLYKFYK